MLLTIEKDNFLLTVVKDNFLYLNVVCWCWYFSEGLVQEACDRPYIVFVGIETIYWVFGLLFWLFNYFDVEYYRVENPRPDTLTELDMLPVILRNHGLLTLFHLWYAWAFPTVNVSANFGLLVFRLALLFVMYDIIFYLGHRAMHHSSVYKLLHKQHHTSRASVGISGYYMGVIDFLMEFVVPFYLPLYLLGNDPLVMVVGGIIGQVNGVLSHSGYNLPLMPYETGHQIHHLELHYNYGIMFMDRLFDTRATKLKVNKH
jgi:sterol desaturase/sphingolipid hydroxylase (fatty acid hydroxylase superfamily)